MLLKNIAKQLFEKQNTKVALITYIIAFFQNTINKNVDIEIEKYIDWKEVKSSFFPTICHKSNKIDPLKWHSNVERPSIINGKHSSAGYRSVKQPTTTTTAATNLPHSFSFLSSFNQEIEK